MCKEGLSEFNLIWGVRGSRFPSMIMCGQRQERRVWWNTLFRQKCNIYECFKVRRLVRLKKFLHFRETVAEDRGWRDSQGWNNEGHPSSSPLVAAQLPSHVSATPWTAAHQAFLSLTISWSFLKVMYIASVMPSSLLILWCPLLLLPSIFPSIRVFSSEWVLSNRWWKYWSCSISSSNEFSGLGSLKIDWFDLLVVQSTLGSLFQHLFIHSYFSRTPHHHHQPPSFLWRWISPITPLPHTMLWLYMFSFSLLEHSFLLSPLIL